MRVRILRRERRRDRPRRLLRGRGRVAGRDVGPPRRGGDRRDLVIGAEELRAGLLDRVQLADEDAAVREERGEVDGRAVDVRSRPGHPVDLRDLLARAFRRIRNRVGLEDARGGERRSVGERVAGAEERVVRRAVLGRIGARRHRVPADAGVGRERLEHPVRAGHAVLHQILVGGHRAGLGVFLHQVRPHPVRCEQHDLLDGPDVIDLFRAGRAGTDCHHYRSRRDCDGHEPKSAKSPCHRSPPPPRSPGRSQTYNPAPPSTMSLRRQAAAGATITADRGARVSVWCPAFRPRARPDR